mmetsp:Transcript_45709/g.102588  ORF Transcript_45709/g.102588 Transcript_45709/m.102588 type:complete len:213 (+) Transcript_45709:394-1032(+)
MSSEDFDEMILHAQGERVVNEVCQLICALIAQEWPVGEREVLDVHRSRDDATRDIQSLSDVPFHLSAEDRCGFCPSDHICYLRVVICDEDLITQASHVLAEPVSVMLAEGSRPNHVDTHLPGQHLCHRCGMCCVTEHDCLLAREVLAIDGAREPCRLRNKATLFIDVLLEVELVALWFQQRGDGTYKLRRRCHSHWASVDVGHVELLLQESS